ncbi:GPP34 family phosphoprotein [Microbacterium sp.]|uniref:GOLPH3/VPS74 family protein n=1 Tax=Microbacterium sp. TaxID=51671 RepID=UPI0033418C14
MITASPSLTDALFVLAHRPDGRRIIQGKVLRIGLGGAALLDLIVRGHASVIDGEVAAVLTGPVPSGLIGDLDRQIRAEPARRSAKHWVKRFRGVDLSDRVADEAAARGFVSSMTTVSLGLFAVVRHVPTARARDEIVTRVSEVLTGHRDPDDWDSALVALCRATRLVKKAFPGTTKARIEAVTGGGETADAVRKVIAQANAAVNNAIIATVNANNGSQGF